MFLILMIASLAARSDTHPAEPDPSSRAWRLAQMVRALPSPPKGWVKARPGGPPPPGRAQEWSDERRSARREEDEDL
jgi:hypothetical protein